MRYRMIVPLGLKSARWMLRGTNKPKTEPTTAIAQNSSDCGGRLSSQLLDVFLQRFAIAKVLDFEQMTCRAQITNSVAKIDAGLSFFATKAVCLCRVALLSKNELGNQLCLIIYQAPLAAIGLNQSGDEECVICRMEDIQKQVGPVFVPI